MLTEVYVYVWVVVVVCGQTGKKETAIIREASSLSSSPSPSSAPLRPVTLLWLAVFARTGTRRVTAVTLLSQHSSAPARNSFPPAATKSNMVSNNNDRETKYQGNLRDSSPRTNTQHRLPVSIGTHSSSSCSRRGQLPQLLSDWRSPPLCTSCSVLV